MKKSFDWAKAAFAALVFLALPFIAAGFVAYFVWFGLHSGWFVFGKMLDWTLGDDPEIADLARQALDEIDGLPEWMRD